MRVLLLTESLGRKGGGLSVATLHLAIGLAKQFPFHDHLILVQKDINDEGIEIDYQIPKNLSILRVNKIGPKIYPISFNLLECIERFNPDVLYLKGLWRQTSYSAYRWKMRNKSKLLLVSPAGMLEPIAFNQKKFIKKLSFLLLEKRLINNCDTVHTISSIENNTLIDLQAKEKLTYKSIFCLPEGLPLDYYDSSDTKYQFTKKLIFISRIAPIKGLDLLINALSDIDFNGWKCEIYGGGDSKYVKEINDMITNSKLNSNVELKGAISGDNKISVFKNSSAFILPSYSEGFAIAIAEAMAFGLPVITTTSTPWQVIRNKNLGWFVEPQAHQIKLALEQLFHSSPLRLEEMGSRAREFIEKTNDWNYVAKSMKKELLSLLSDKKL